METKEKHINDLHFEHKLWKNNLEFYFQELEIYEHRLEDFANRYADKEFLSELEQFQNRFIRQKELATEALHEIKKHDQALSEYAEEHPEGVENLPMRDHKQMREKIEDFERLYKELKGEFRKFSSKWV